MRLSLTLFLLLILLTGCKSYRDTVPTNREANTSANVNSTPSNTLPEFPWPPNSSAVMSIPSELLVKAGSSAKLADVDNRLRRALQQGGYEKFGYYHIPGGFVVVTQLEQFDGATGTPLADANRWSTTTAPPRLFTLEYFRSLIKGTSGHFRVIAFAVTNKPFQETGKVVAPSEAATLASGGSNSLPSDVRDQAYGEDYQCTALVYEFLQPNSGPARFVNSSALLASRHLQKILPYLEQSL